MKRVLFGLLAPLIQLSIAFPSVQRNLKDDGRNPELGDKFEGDMILSPEQLEQLHTSKSGAIYDGWIWLTNIVPYEFDESTGHTEESKARVREAMSLIMNKTSNCVKFVDHTNEDNYVTILYNTGRCYSQVGKTRRPEPQTLSIDPTCSTGSIVHELLHTLGFMHEQRRYDRDDYVRINFENIRKGFEDSFEKENPLDFGYYNVSYDYDSIMHYGSDYWGKKGADGKDMETITVLKEGAPKIGQRDHLSEKDIQRIINMYCPSVA